MCSLTPRQRAPYAMAIASTRGERETRCAPRENKAHNWGNTRTPRTRTRGMQRAQRPTRAPGNGKRNARRNERAPREVARMSDERRQQIVDAARQLYEEQGLSATTVKDISEALRRGAVAVLPLLPQQAGGHLRRHRRFRERLHRVAAVLERAPHPRRYRRQPGGRGHRHARGRLRALQLPPRARHARERVAVPGVHQPRGRPHGSLLRGKPPCRTTRRTTLSTSITSTRRSTY